MRQWLKLIAFAVCLSLVFSLASCTDFGVGENEDALGEYFSRVYVLSENGSRSYPISHFNEDVELEDMEIPVVVPYDEYCYIGFRVADGYTLSISEFAFFVKAESGNGVLDLEFYTVDKMPTSIKNSDGSDVVIADPDSEGSSEAESDTESGAEADAETNTGTGSEENTEASTETAENIREDDLFLPNNRFFGYTFSVGEEWDSVLLQFDGSKTVKGGEYVIVRIRNNCFSDSSDGSFEPIAFTFNYLLFYVNSAHK